jgi:hypothetical protein
MATVTSNKCSAGVQPHGNRVGLVATTAVYSPGTQGPTSLSTGDVIQMIKVPQNSQVHFVAVHCNLSGQGSFIVGDGVSTSRYIAASLLSVSAGSYLFPSTANQGYVPYTYSTDDTIDVVISASAQPSSGAIYMTAIVNLDP